MTRAATRAVLHQSGRGLQVNESVPVAKIGRVLVVRPNHRLGNLLLLTPLLQELQDVLPDARVDIVLAGDDGRGLFRTFHNVGRIYTLSRRMVHHPLATVRMAIRFRREKYDLVIDPCAGSQSGRWLVAAAKAAHVIRASGSEPAVDGTRTAGTLPAPAHMAKWPVYRLRQAVTPHDDLLGKGYPTLDIRLSPPEHRRGQHILSVVTASDTCLPPIIGVFADARGAKCYSSDWWLRFIDAVREQTPGCKVVEIAPPDGRSRLASRFPHFSSPDIREVAAIISQMTCFISADCGVMHLGSASGTTTIGLFSVTRATRYAPYGHGSCALDTNGKTPAQMGQLAGRIIQTLPGKGCVAWPGATANAPEIMESLRAHARPHGIDSNTED